MYTLPDTVVKHYTGESWWKQAKEAHVYALLAGVPGVPSVEDVDTDHGVTVMTRVPGEPLATAPDDAMWDLYRQLGTLQAAMHRITQPAFGYLTTEVLDPLPDNTAYMTRQFTAKLAEFAERGGDPEIHRLASVKFAGLLAGYGPLPADGLARIELYRLYHALELWDWFAEIGNTAPLDGIAADIRALASP